jgi:hypothetical protein
VVRLIAPTDVGTIIGRSVFVRRSTKALEAAAVEAAI